MGITKGEHMSDTNEANFKKIDEDWKDAVQKGRTKHEGNKEGQAPPPKANFAFFISTLAMETLLALGDMENPITKKKSVNLTQAQYLIDTIDMLKSKAKGNLTAEEETFIEGILPDLKLRYVNKAK